MGVGEEVVGDGTGTARTELLASAMMAMLNKNFILKAEERYFQVQIVRVKL